MRENGGSPQIDLNNNVQIGAKNVVIMFVNETLKADGSHTRHEMNNLSGGAYIFKDGVVTHGNWNKPNETTMPIFTDANGAEISFNPGQIWVEVVATDMPVGIE